MSSDIRLPGASLPFLVVGSIAIVAGGVVAAVARPTGFEEGSWLAAYLVLVGGVALIGLGVGRALFAPEPPPMTTVGAELGAWVLSTAIIAAGTLTSTPILTVVGSVVLVAALASFIASVRGSVSSGLPIWVYRGILVVLLVSIPIGVLLAWQRHA